MAANPSLQTAADGRPIPVPFVTEVLALRREAIELVIDGVRTTSRRWSARGLLYLTTLRLVFVAQETHESGINTSDILLELLPAHVCAQAWKYTENWLQG